MIFKLLVLIILIIQSLFLLITPIFMLEIGISSLIELPGLLMSLITVGVAWYGYARM